jgi:hypothetical protein
MKKEEYLRNSDEAFETVRKIYAESKSLSEEERRKMRSESLEEMKRRNPGLRKVPSIYKRIRSI